MGPLPTTTTPRGDPDNLSCASRKNWSCSLQTDSQDVAGLRDHSLLTHWAEPRGARQGSQASTMGTAPVLLSCSQEWLGAATASEVSMGVPGATAPTVSQPYPQCSNAKESKEEKPRDRQSYHRLSLGTTQGMDPAHGNFEQSLQHCRTGRATVNTSICAPTHAPSKWYEEKEHCGATRSNMAKWVTSTGNNSV